MRRKCPTSLYAKNTVNTITGNIITKKKYERKVHVNIDIVDIGDCLISAVLCTPGDMIINFKKILLVFVVSFVGERVLNAWNGLPTDVDFRTSTAYKRTTGNIDFSSYLKRH